MCEKYLVMMEEGDHHEFVDSLDAAKKSIIERAEYLCYDTVEDYLLNYDVEVYEIAKQTRVSVETKITYNLEFK